MTSYALPDSISRIRAAKVDQTPVVATEDPNWNPDTARMQEILQWDAERRRALPGVQNPPMIATRPPRSMTTYAPGYTGPRLPPGDYSTYIPSNRLSGPSLTLPGGRPGIGVGQGYRRGFDVGGGIQGGIEGARNPGDLPWWISAGVGVITGGLGGSTGSGGSAGSSSSAALASEGTGSCPSGYERDAQGRCVRSGLGGAVERLVPGGETGMLPQGRGYGPAVMGAFGIPAIQPSQTGTVIAGDGTVRPTLGCPPGAVLGKDNLCYMKGSIPRQFRKWKPKPRPVMSAADGKTLRKADRLKNKVKKLAQGAGFTCRKR